MIITRRMETGFADEEVPAVFQPCEHVAGEHLDLVVTQVHEKPIGENDVEFLVGRQLQFGDIGTQKVHVSVMTVPLSVLLNVIGHEIDCCQVFGVFCQVISEPP